MKFKVGDRVRIRSYEWYCENRDEDGIIPILEDRISEFDPNNIECCGKVVVIDRITDDGYYRIGELIDWGLGWLKDEHLEPEPVVFEYCIEINGMLEPKVYFTEEEVNIAFDVWKTARPMDEIRIRVLNL